MAKRRVEGPDLFYCRTNINLIELTGNSREMMERRRVIRNGLQRRMMMTVFRLKVLKVP